MLKFAVEIEGVTEEGQARWVLAIDPTGERVLTADPVEKSLQWHLMADCKFARFISPERPIPVVHVQPTNGPALMVPNRTQRRQMGREGG